MNAQYAFYSATFLGLLPELWATRIGVKVILMDEKIAGTLRDHIPWRQGFKREKTQSLYTEALAET
jgi:hypothetical protein